MNLRIRIHDQKHEALLVLLVPVESRVGLAPSPRPSSSYRSPERPPNQSHTFPFQKVLCVTWYDIIYTGSKPPSLPVLCTFHYFSNKVRGVLYASDCQLPRWPGISWLSLVKNRTPQHIYTRSTGCIYIRLNSYAIQAPK